MNNTGPTPYTCGLADDPGLSWDAYHEAEAMAPVPPRAIFQVTATKPGQPVEVVAEFGNGYDATQFATKFFTTRAARGKVITIREQQDD